MKNYRIEKELKILTRDEQEDQDLEFWSKKSYAEKLDACFFLLNQYLDMHPDVPRRLQRVAKITQRKISFRKTEEVDEVAGSDFNSNLSSYKEFLLSQR